MNPFPITAQTPARFAAPPPMALQALLEASDLTPAMHGVIDALRIKKRDTPELGLEPRIAELDTWALAELARLDPTGLGLPDVGQPGSDAEADRLFMTTIGLGG